MQKKISLLCVLLLALVGTVFAQEFEFSDISAKITVPEGYTVLQKNALEQYKDLIETAHYTVEELRADFEARGVLLQAWKEDTIFEVSAVQNEQSKNIFDVDRQDETIRGAYRVGFFPRNIYVSEGYTYKSAGWKNFGKNVGRFLVAQYTKDNNGIKEYTAFERRTIKNGYEIAISMKAVNRNVTNKENVALNKIFKTFGFTKTEEMSEEASAAIVLKNTPPKESKYSKIEISGQAAQGVEFTAAVMSLGAKEPELLKTTADSKNKFSLPISLPKQGVYLITLTANQEGEELGEWAFPVTYREGLLSVSFQKEPEGVITEDNYRIQGTAEPGANIQVLLNNQTVGNRRTNNEGKFIIPLDTKEAGEYEVVLVFTKKDLQSRRFKFTFTREVSAEQQNLRLAKTAINVPYSNLKNTGGKYVGRVIKFNVYVADVTAYENQFILHTAFIKNGDKLSQYAYILSDTQVSDFYLNRRIQGVAEFLGLSSELASVTLPEAESNVPVFKLITINE